MQNRLKPHWRLVIILLLYLSLATAHSLIAPFTLGNDEWAHFLYTRFIAEHGRLPVTLAERENKEEVGTKSDDPPLYHLIVSAAASSVEPVRLLRPINNDEPRRQLADNVVVSYAFLVHNAYEMFPFRGELLLWYIGRLLAILFGGVVIVLTYLTSLMLFSSRKQALVTAALLSFIPAFIFHSSVMSYDSLGAVFSALFLAAAIKAVKQPGRWRWWLSLGALAGLAITTKYTSVLLPIEIVFIAWLAFREARRRTETSPIEKPANIKSKSSLSLAAFLPRLIVAGLALTIMTGWWFGFIIWHFNTIDTHGPWLGILEPLLVRGGNDSTAVSLTAIMFGESSVSTDLPAPARPRNYPQLAWLMIESFWSAPVAEQFLLSPWLPLLFTGTALLSLFGLGRLWQKSGMRQRTWLLLLGFHVLLVLPLILIRVIVSFDPLEAVQGRHLLFPGASAVAILLVWGWQQWHRKLGQFVVAGLLLWSVIGQVGWAAAAYPDPIPVWTEKESEAAPVGVTPMDERWPEGMRLTGVSWPEAHHGASLELSLWWRSEAVIASDYLIELRLLDEAGRVASYSLGQPVQGRYPTRAWEPGDLVKDVHWLPLVGSLNGVYQLQLRLLDRAAQPLPEDKTVTLGQVPLAVDNQAQTGCAPWVQGRPASTSLLSQPYRLRSSFTVIAPETPLLRPLSDQSGSPEQMPLVSMNNFHLFMVGPDWTETYRLFVGSQACARLQFDLPARNFALPEIPNPLAVNFNNEVKLLGYELPTRRIQPGQRLPLTLYWQALDYMGEDYHIFDNLLDNEQQRWGGYDRRAKDGYSTLLWAPGEIIVDRFGVPVDPAAPPGIYTLDIGLYRKEEKGAASLPIVVDGQFTEQNSIRLGPIKVGGPPPDVTTTDPSPQVLVHRSFDDQITLLGYDIVSVQPNLELILYWQAERSPAVDYTTFFHLRNDDDENVAQKDGPPGGGAYPTSLWDAGEIVVDRISLPLTEIPSGEYIPVVGLYDFSTGARLPLTEPAESVEQVSAESVPAGQASELRLEAVTVP